MVDSKLGSTEWVYDNIFKFTEEQKERNEITTHQRPKEKIQI